MKGKNRFTLAATLGASLLLTMLPATAQLLYFENFDSDVSSSGNWAINALGNSPADLYFDYSTVGVPPAPNSTNGTTRGLKLNANLGEPAGTAATGVFPGGVSVTPMNFLLPMNDSFVVHADYWLNFNGPAPAGGSGSTQEGGMGFGTTGSGPQVVGLSDSLFFVTTPDGGTASDYRIYSAVATISYQDGNPSYLAGSRNNTAALYSTNFAGQSPPAAQTALYSQQTGTAQNGTLSFKWHDFKIEKIGPYVTWSVDNVPLAVVDATTNGIAGDKLLFTLSDINAGNSTDPNAGALAFTLFDNIRVSNIVANVVSVSAPGSSASEAGPSSGTFTLARTITGTPLTVNYKMSGTASNGLDYTNILGGALSGSVTFPANASTVDITFMPVDDAISEPTETVTLTVLNGANYTAAGSATATISDNDTPLLVISPASPSMYERHTNDWASVKVTRWGDTSTTLTLDAANFTLSGTAVKDTDFVVNTGVFPFTINGGEVESQIQLVSPLDNAVYTGNKTIVVALTAGSGYGVASSNASLTIIDDENPPATVLYSNALNNAADAVNWGITYANGDIAGSGASDYEASFGYDLVADPTGAGPISLPPNGSTKALRTTVNKQNGSNAGLNLYPTNVTFSGDYAVRFNMNLIMDSGSGTTQGAIFGINHDGKETNWWAGSGVVSGGPWASDGIWYWISADAGAAAGDYLLRTGNGGVLPNTGWVTPVTAVSDDFTNYFKGPPAPYSGSSGPGLVANNPVALGGDNRNWTDVEIRQIGRNVSLYLNKIRVLNYSNSTAFTSGTIMLGYSDPFNSVGSPDGAVYYSNVRVVRLSGPQVTNITRNGSNVTITFTSPDGLDSASSFKLQKSGVVGSGYADDMTATITQLPDGTYRATTTSGAAQQFFRIAKTL